MKTECLLQFETYKIIYENTIEISGINLFIWN